MWMMPLAAVLALPLQLGAVQMAASDLPFEHSTKECAYDNGLSAADVEGGITVQIKRMDANVPVYRRRRSNQDLDFTSVDIDEFTPDDLQTGIYEFSDYRTRCHMIVTNNTSDDVRISTSCLYGLMFRLQVVSNDKIVYKLSTDIRRDPGGPESEFSLRVEAGKSKDYDLELRGAALEPSEKSKPGDVQVYHTGRDEAVTASGETDLDLASMDLKRLFSSHVGIVHDDVTVRWYSRRAITERRKNVTVK